MSDQHPDYLAVPEEKRWGKPLNLLFPALQKEAWTLRGGWAWRVLPHGALVSVRIVPPEEGKESAFHLDLRIARKTAPADVEGWRKWSGELAVFLKHMAGGDTDWQETNRSTDKAEATFRFLMRGEKDKPPEPKCSRCGKTPVIDAGLYKVDLCRECAIELANQEVAANKAGREPGDE
jgi:hypothetical protein